MNTNVKILVNALLFSLIALFPTISHADDVLPPVGGTDDGATSATTDTALPPVGGTDDGATPASTDSSLSPTGGTNDGATPAPVEPVSQPSTGGSSPTGGFGGGSSFSSNVPLASALSTTSTSTASTTSPLAGGSCPLITNFLQIGADNNNTDVIKLQAFLKTTEKLDVDLSGIFDSKTEAGVKAFQAKYLTDTMGPWKSATPSGKVYITTKKKINEIACNSAINLTSDEQATINSYLQGNLNGSTTVGTAGPSVPTTTPTIGENLSNNNTASVVNAPVIQRVWNFIKGIFSR